MWHKHELLRRALGLPGRPRARARLTPTPAGCGCKLAAAGGERYVVNVWGVGYRLLAPVDAPEHNGSAA